MNVNLKRNGKEYEVLNKCVNKYLTNNNESLDLETINNIEHLLNMHLVFLHQYLQYY